jgi:hypothetical protein
MFMSKSALADSGSFDESAAFGGYAEAKHCGCELARCEILSLYCAKLACLLFCLVSFALTHLKL